MRFPNRGFVRLLRLLLVSLLAIGAVAVMVRFAPLPFSLSSEAPRAEGYSDLISQLFQGNLSIATQSPRYVITAEDLREALATVHTAYRNASAFHPTPFPAPRIPASKTPFDLTMPVSGKLGNTMFQYASLLGIAYLNGRTPHYKTSSKLKRIFQVTHVKDVPDKGLPVLFEKNFATYDPKFEHLPDKTLALLQYFQSWKYFDFIRDTIKKEFTFQQGVKDQALALINKYSGQIGSKVKVGVHVRRGDMVINASKKKGYYTAPVSYITKAMDFMRRKHGDVIFLVVSDDANWCRAQLKNTPDYVIMDVKPAEVHMALLTLCDHVIMTVGTFGWWGGYLGGGDVVYYWDRKECLHDPPLPVEIRHPEDFFLPDWIPLTG